MAAISIPHLKLIKWARCVASEITTRIKVRHVVNVVDPLWYSMFGVRPRFTAVWIQIDAGA